MKRSLTAILILVTALVNPALFSQPAYQTTTPMTFPRQMYGSVVLGNYLYLIGGNEPGKGYINSVQMARITDTGALGSWQNTSPLPRSLSYIENSTLALNDMLYIVAGLDGVSNTCMNAIQWARPKADGHLEGWRESPSYPGAGVHCTAAVATPGYIHLIAGLKSDNTPEKAVWTARVAANGSILGWEPGPTFPITLFYHNAGVAGGHVWVWGGLKVKDNMSVNTSIYCAPILSSGKLGPWAVSPATLPTGFYAAAGTVSGSYLFSFCPRYSGGGVNASSDIWYAEVTQSGISPWIRETTDLKGKLYLGLATDYRRSIVYIPGGRVSFADKTAVDTSVRFFQLNRQATADARTDAAQTLDRNYSASGDTHLSFSAANNQPSVFPGFVSLNQALEQQAVARRPMVIYFHQERALLCQQQGEILKHADLSRYVGRVIFAEVNMLQYPQTGQQYGVFRVPTWLFYDAAGNRNLLEDGVITPDRLTSNLAALAP